MMPQMVGKYLFTDLKYGPGLFYTDLAEMIATQRESRKTSARRPTRSRLCTGARTMFPLKAR